MRNFIFCFLLFILICPLWSQVPNPGYVSYLLKHQQPGKNLYVYFQASNNKDTARQFNDKFVFYCDSVVQQYDTSYKNLQYTYYLQDTFVTEVRGSDGEHLFYHHKETPDSHISFTTSTKNSDTTTWAETAKNGSWKKVWLKGFCNDSIAEIKSGDTTFHTEYSYTKDGWFKNGTWVFIEHIENDTVFQTRYASSYPAGKSYGVYLAKNGHTYCQISRYRKDYPDQSWVEEKTWYLWE